jgi:pimeloyl-ACP methyl ester carboxylesterase
MTEQRHGNVQANGINVHYVEQGEGPLVVFCHGFPESWYSWRHQLPAVAEAGFRPVALDMRGYGQTSQPEAVEDYSLSHLVGDVVGVVNGLGYDEAVVIGHDWGGPVAWHSALMRPDLFRAVGVLSVPFNPPMALPAGMTVSDLMRANAAGRNYYRLYFQKPGVAESELEADVPRNMLGFMYGVSGDIVRDGIHPHGWDGHFPPGEKLLDRVIVPDSLPAWLTQADLDFYVSEISRSGFRGGLNWYRNIDRIPGILAPFIGRTIEQPSLYMYGEYDLIAGNTPEAVAALPKLLPGLTDIIRCEGAGHWLQQECVEQVNEGLLKFLGNL